MIDSGRLVDRDTRRARLCSCSPWIIFELLFPLLHVGLISYFCRDVLGEKESDELNQLFAPRNNDACSIDGWKNVSDEKKDLQHFSLGYQCDDQSTEEESFSEAWIFPRYSSDVEGLGQRIRCFKFNGRKLCQWDDAENDRLVNDVLFANDCSNMDFIIPIQEILSLWIDRSDA